MSTLPLTGRNHITMLGDKGLIKYSSSFFLVKTRAFLVKCLHIVQNKCFQQS